MAPAKSKQAQKHAPSALPVLMTLIPAVLNPHTHSSSNMLVEQPDLEHVKRPMNAFMVCEVILVY